MAMKIVVGILLFVLAAYLVGFFMPQTYEVTRSVVIAAPRAEIHASLQDVSTWKEWSAFVPPGEASATIASKYEGPQAGVGATWIWGKDLDDKPARLEVVTSDAKWGIAYKLELDGGRVKSSGDILFQEDEGGTRVTFVNAGEMATPWSRYFGLVADKAVGPALEQSLEGLRKSLDEESAVESAPEGASAETAQSETAPEAQTPEEPAAAAGH